MIKGWLFSTIMMGLLYGMPVEAVDQVTKEQMDRLKKSGWDAYVGKGTGVWVSVARQRLYLIKEYHIYASYRCSTASAGTGNREGSNQTPLGWHAIAKKIGSGLPKGAILKERQFTGKVWKASQPVSDDLILSRILWLKGLEPGLNVGAGIDTHDRYIYIHATPEEDKLGTPASHGCIRLSNDDVIALYTHAKVGMPVLITPW